jgi:hypothetical protein
MMTYLELLAAEVAVAIIIIFAGVVTVRLLRRENRSLARTTVGLEAVVESVRNDRDAVLGGKDVQYDFFSLAIDRVETRYSQLNLPPDVPDRIDAERTIDAEGSIGIGIQSLMLGASEKRESRQRTTFANESNPHRKFRAIQHLYYSRGDVTLVNLVDGFDKAPLAPIYQAIEQLELDIRGYEAPPEAVRLLEESLRKTQEQRDPYQRSRPGNQFAIRASWEVAVGPRPRTVILRTSWGSSCIVSTTVHCNDEYRGRGGSEEMRPSRIITATCFGTIEEDSPRGEIIIDHTAIYRFLFDGQVNLSFADSRARQFPGELNEGLCANRRHRGRRRLCVWHGIRGN